MLESFEIEGGILRRYRGDEAHVVIPEGVTEIGKLAFWGCKSLASVSIAQGVVEIGKLAFEGCYALASVSIPESVTQIGSYVFALCEGLTVICPCGSCAWGYCEDRGIPVKPKPTWP